MLNRSRSWPVQSVITLDPRGIICARVETTTIGQKSKIRAEEQNEDGCATAAKPDIVLEANDRLPFPTKPDIFLTLEPKINVSGPGARAGESLEIKFVDHYRVLDSVSGKEDQAFVVSVPSEELSLAESSIPRNKMQERLDESALDSDLGAFLGGTVSKSDKNVIRISADVERSNTGSAICQLCSRGDSKVQRKVERKSQEDVDEIRVVPEESNQLLSSYQIDILRQNCLKSLNKRRESSFELTYSLDKDSGEKPRKPFERKLTSDFESVASNETKTTDCDEKCGPRRNIKRDGGPNSFQLIRSYSLGHEKTRQKLTGTFKKFSLPTPVTQLKEGTEQLETGTEDKDTLPRNLNLDKRKVTTLTRHYYPEGGWGFVIVTCSVMVHILCHGLQLAAGVIMIPAAVKFKTDAVHTGWLGALSTAVALLLSPITIAFCRRKSTRVTAVVGGLITALGCLFTSFASQFHQLFFSYGTVIGVGVSLTRDCSTLMVAQYFKRRRELVEIFIVSGSGLGISIMSACIQGAINAIGWRLGLQAVTGVIFLTFILGTFYRSASLYHPQRRAILHLKNQKRKIKDKNKVEDKPAFLDTTALRSKTVRILLASTGLSAFGINTPIFYLARQAEQEGLGERAVLLQAYLGLAWVLGCAAFGLVVVHNSVECRIARQYLCQAAVFMCGLAILALTAVHGNYHGYVLFVWIYGIFCGGYHYSLKMYTYEKVRARNFARTWGFVQCSQAIPIALGVPISGYMNEGCGGKAGYYFSSTCTLAGSLAMFLIDVHRRRIARHKHTKANGQRHLCESDSCPRRRPSIGAEPDPEPQLAELPVAELIPGIPGEKPELTCISEEGIADMDLPDNLLDDLDYIGITSCNKVENYLMLSEFENNLIAETPVVLDKRGRRWSLARRSEDTPDEGGRWRLVPPRRTITVIDEASV